MSMTMTMSNDCLMTIPELMKFLQVKRNTIYTLRRLGLPTEKIGRSVRFQKDSILSWLKNMEGTQQQVMPAYDGKSSEHLL